MLARPARLYVRGQTRGRRGADAIGEAHGRGDIAPTSPGSQPVGSNFAQNYCQPFAGGRAAAAWAWAAPILAWPSEPEGDESQLAWAAQLCRARAPERQRNLPSLAAVVVGPRRSEMARWHAGAPAAKIDYTGRPGVLGRPSSKEERKQAAPTRVAATLGRAPPLPLEGASQGFRRRPIVAGKHMVAAELASASGGETKARPGDLARASEREGGGGRIWQRARSRAALRWPQPESWLVRSPAGGLK